MSSKWLRKLDYIRERAVNALWMLKEGDFKQITKSVYLEVHYRLEDIKEWVRLARLLEDSQVQGSNYCNKSRVQPPSPSPTRQVRGPAVSPKADSKAVAKELNDILAALAVRDNHSL
ncbi:MAG: hypothetical protein HRT77_14130 [Halioglobus sp.]|nr:hypothetical protein [Halioglobus sp.]